MDSPVVLDASWAGVGVVPRVVSAVVEAGFVVVDPLGNGSTVLLGAFPVHAAGGTRSTRSATASRRRFLVALTTSAGC
jgi:hypothetical protein